MRVTPFHSLHLEAGARMTPFSGYDMPLHYGSQIAEHEAVRQAAGMFDVSHMMITDVSGVKAREFLRKLIANDVVKLEKVGYGKALYSPMLNLTGGVVDDVIVYWMPFGYRIVSNAGTREKVTQWLKDQAAQMEVQLTERVDLAMLAVQGPLAIQTVLKVFPTWREAVQGLSVFQGVQCGAYFVARTGYTGEEGVEIILPTSEAHVLWHGLLQEEVQPCGLAARDTLRLEAGMNLYGIDMDDSVNPLEAGLAWCVDLKDESRDFVGKQAIIAHQKTAHPKQVGLLLLGKGVLRGHQVFRNEQGALGEVTSGTFSPTLKQSIALARVPAETGTQGQVEIRGEWQAVKVVPLPFVRNGKILTLS